MSNQDTTKTEPKIEPKVNPEPVKVNPEPVKVRSIPESKEPPKGGQKLNG
ncbi:MAG: hypothetical protein IPP60_08255 [Sphingobacteriales bacterium]|nr:hypothetical protein [Sphingobacteriales bacterium]